MHPSAKRSTPEVRKLGHIWNVITPADMVFQTYVVLRAVLRMCPVTTGFS